MRVYYIYIYIYRNLFIIIIATKGGGSEVLNDMAERSSTIAHNNDVMSNSFVHKRLSLSLICKIVKIIAFCVFCINKHCCPTSDITDKIRWLSFYTRVSRENQDKFPNQRLTDGEKAAYAGCSWIRIRPPY